VKTGENYLTEGNLYYVEDEFGEKIPVCKECKKNNKQGISRHVGGEIQHGYLDQEGGEHYY